MLINKYIFGLDLGQQNDYTVISALETVFIDNELNYSLPFIHKFPLKTPYPDIVNSISKFIENKLYIKNDYILVIDYTGVGHPVVDLFKKRNMKIISINITGGNKSIWASRLEANVPKRDIVSSIQVVMQNNRLKIASDLPLLADLNREFLGFKVKIAANGRDSYSAVSGLHDDIIMSIGIALWYGENRNKSGSNVRIIGGN